MPGMRAHIEAYEAAHPGSKGEKHSYRSLFQGVLSRTPELEYAVEVNSFASKAELAGWAVANFSALLDKAHEPELFAANEWYDVLLPVGNNTTPGS